MIEPIDIEDMKTAIKQHYPKATLNPPLLEKMFYALRLAELLQINGLNFTFKGGTSLILLLAYPQRFSIDIDIITEATKKDIETILATICQNQHVFFGYELQKDRSYKGTIPKAHYKLNFEAQETGQNDNHILLDILFDENPYPQTLQLPIDKNWLKTSNPITNVNVPSIESIVGDKLTAFAPNTTGIEYGKEKQTEIIKQMFDIGQLFDEIKNFEIVIQSFEKIATKEIEYRPKLKGKTSLDVAQDTFQTCLQVIKQDNTELTQGIKTFKNWTFLSFNRDDAFLCATKIAYIAAKIIKKDRTPLEKPITQKIDKKEFLIEETTYNFLNKPLKNIPNNALFYAYKAIKTLTS